MKSGNVQQIYRYAASSYDYEINIVVPDGYYTNEADGGKMNIKVENECGVFVSTVSQTDNGLLLKAHERFNKAHEPASNWNKITELLDVAVNFEYVVLLLKKDMEHKDDRLLR